MSTPSRVVSQVCYTPYVAQWGRLVKGLSFIGALVLAVTAYCIGVRQERAQDDQFALLHAANEPCAQDYRHEALHTVYAANLAMQRGVLTPRRQELYHLAIRIFGRLDRRAREFQARPIERSIAEHLRAVEAFNAETVMIYRRDFAGKVDAKAGAFVRSKGIPTQATTVAEIAATAAAVKEYAAMDVGD